MRAVLGNRLKELERKEISLEEWAIAEFNTEFHDKVIDIVQLLQEKEKKNMDGKLKDWFTSNLCRNSIPTSQANYVRQQQSTSR